MQLNTISQMGQYYNHYYEKFTEAIKLKCGYDLDHIIKYVLCKKVSNCNYKLVIFAMQITFIELVVCHLCILHQFS